VKVSDSGCKEFRNGNYNPIMTAAVVDGIDVFVFPLSREI